LESVEDEDKDISCSFVVVVLVVYYYTFWGIKWAAALTV